METTGMSFICMEAMKMAPLRFPAQPLMYQGVLAIEESWWRPDCD
jgi:hypothetical protein